jgi:cation:H+ antiporter
MIWLYILIFLISCFFLYFAGEMVIECLGRIAKFLGWKEFVVAFLIMAFAASLPDLFVGIFSALRGKPQLSLGDVIGANLVDLTLTVALATLFSRAGISAESRTVQTSSLFTIGVAILCLLLISDGILSRSDGIILLLFFAFYFSWLFSKKERFVKIFDKYQIPFEKKFETFIKDLVKVIFGIILLLLASEGIVRSAIFFSENLKIPLTIIGLFIVGIGNALPETYFGIVSAKKGETWLILGDLMGSVIITTALVLGIVALICPIKIEEMEIRSFTIARIFMIISSLFFFFSVRTDRKITKKEGIFLLSLYLAFLIVEILLK